MSDYRYEIKFILNETSFSDAMQWLYVCTNAVNKYPDRYINSIYLDNLEYDSVKDLLQLYCSALAGVDLEILPSSELVDKNIGWSSTMNPTTEGKSIYVPEIINRYDSKIINYKWFKVISSHQVK